MTHQINGKIYQTLTELNADFRSYSVSHLHHWTSLFGMELNTRGSKASSTLLEHRQTGRQADGLSAPLLN